MKVLVFGATGFIGHEVALAYVRAGHDVIGTTRSAESAKGLEAEEITPKVCDGLDASQWRHLISEADVVVDCSGGDISKTGPYILDVTIKEAEKSRPNGPPLSYIYCSGTWVHGDERHSIISDRTPTDHPMPLTSWRLDIERKAITSISKSFTANILRPSLLYGGSASIFAGVFQSAKDGAIVWKGDAGARVSTVHKTDVGEAFRLAGEKSYAVPGVIFDISNDYSEPIMHILEQLKTVSAAKSIEFVKPASPFEDAATSSAVLRPQLARSLLGWRPQRAPLAEGIKVYYHAWLAHQA